MKIKFLLLDIHIFKYYFYKQYCLNGLKISFNFYYHSLLKVEERLRYKFSFFKFQLSFVVHSVNSTFFENLEFVPIDWSRAKVRSENLGTDIFIYIYSQNRERIRFLYSVRSVSKWKRRVPWLRSAIRLRSIAPASARKSYIISRRGCDRSTGRAS